MNHQDLPATGRIAEAPPIAAASGVRALLALARAAQPPWAARPVSERLRVIRRLRGAIAAQPSRIAEEGYGRGRTPVETLAYEIVPLLDACRFLERRAEALLRPQRLGRRGRPAWLFAHDAEIRREPKGVVLVIAPDNYPLFLPGVQLLQALVAGNAVLIKPAPGCSGPVQVMRDMLAEVGLPDELCQVLGETPEEARQAIAAGVDHLVLTGSAPTGRAVLAELAPQLTPATMELSGSDAVFVLPGADLDLTADALTFGLRLNAGATCIAPRRVFVAREHAAALEDGLTRRLEGGRPLPVTRQASDRLQALLDDARERGGRVVPGCPEAGEGLVRPTAVFDADPHALLLQADIFAPVLGVVPVQEPDEALALDALCPYALGASVFGPPEAARRVAEKVRAGSVVVNDLVVPTADPRLSFGGRGRSGFGVTRGAEGLLEMTCLKTISVRRGRFRPHYEPLPAKDGAALIRAWLQAAHGRGAGTRLRGLGRLVRGLARLSRRRRRDNAS